MQMDGEKLQLFDTYCSFREEIYGGSHSFTKNGLGLDVLYIISGHDHFKICLADKTRFGKYDLYHRNWGEKLGGGYNWHKQATCRDIGKAIFSAYQHEISKECRLRDSLRDDYDRFLADFKASLYKI